MKNFDLSKFNAGKSYWQEKTIWPKVKIVLQIAKKVNKMSSEIQNGTKDIVRKKTRKSIDDFGQLIELYRSHECLWDFRNPLYKNKIEHQRAYKDIMLEINFDSAEEVTKKIKSMRDTYTSEKIENLVPELTMSRVLLMTKVHAIELKLNFHFTYLQFLENKISNECSYERALSSEDAQDKLTFEPARVPKKMRTHQENVPNHIQSAIIKLEEIRKASTVSDEFHHFGQTIAFQLRNMPKLNAYVLQDRIQRIVSEERIKYERERANCESSLLSQSISCNPPNLDPFTNMKEQTSGLIRTEVLQVENTSEEIHDDDSSFSVTNEKDASFITDLVSWTDPFVQKNKLTTEDRVLLLMKQNGRTQKDLMIHFHR
ncbi:uncharacterized protein LOC131426433 [Malaya genurostris]|uniref:uncharacterized protein LOC131426433 n=1 Tax=Malaya genurostris TaxID=325434 RepID=UPI0026F3E7B2|nr:uncharacterized protein LOC131426433 [Malaya genurostris]